tara:strand:+ start:166 stop:480 length:315 start_codon:yes stop_codon:yes gene_type:complete
VKPAVRKSLFQSDAVIGILLPQVPEQIRCFSIESAVVWIENECETVVATRSGQVPDTLIERLQPSPELYLPRVPWRCWWSNEGGRKRCDQAPRATRLIEKKWIT